MQINKLFPSDLIYLYSICMFSPNNLLFSSHLIAMSEDDDFVHKYIKTQLGLYPSPLKENLYYPTF